MSNQQPIQTIPSSVQELFPSKWLHHDDLNGRTITVRIKRVTFEMLQAHPKTTDKILKGVVDFGRSKSLVMNQTQANSIADIVGSGRFNDWHGEWIALKPGTSHNGRPTILIVPPPHEQVVKPTAAADTEKTAEMETSPADPQEFEEAIAYLETLSEKIAGSSVAALVVSLGFAEDMAKAEKKLLETTSAKAGSVRQIFQRKFSQQEAKNLLTDLQETANRPTSPTVEDMNEMVIGS